MAFKLGDLIIDRIQMGWAEKFDGTPLYVLTQLSDATIDISAESKDAVDKDGTLIKRFWQGKTGTFTATNAMLNLNILGSNSGSDPEIATTAKAVSMPRIQVVKAGDTLTISSGVGASAITVRSLGENGAMGSEVYTAGSAASATEFAVSGTTLTPPTAEGVTQYIVRYDRQVTDGMAIKNKADKFPKTIRLLLKALCVDPCEADTLRACYIELPSFQPSPELSVSLTTDGQLDYTGDLQVDYCSSDKSLYNIYYATEDEED